jgi:hypothetical protein
METKASNRLKLSSSQARVNNHKHRPSNSSSLTCILGQPSLRLNRKQSSKSLMQPNPMINN